MCGRYVYSSSSELLSEYGLVDDDPQTELAMQYPDNFNVSPGNTMPVIIRGEQAHTVEFMEWGLVPFWAKSKDKPIKLINAKEEALTERPTWKKLVQTKRCVVPARGFYEWKSEGGQKVPHYITPKNNDVFSFAGLYDSFTDKDGKTTVCYVIITTAPNAEMSDVHNRMPASLTKQQMDVWLTPGELGRDILDDLLGTPPDEILHIVKVDSAVNNARNNTPDLILPID